jgi:hypothetical protein
LLPAGEKKGAAAEEEEGKKSHIDFSSVVPYLAAPTLLASASSTKQCLLLSLSAGNQYYRRVTYSHAQLLPVGHIFRPAAAAK